jgi:hypothetical protein
MLESGASLVVASHVHVPLGFEQQTHGSVYYGLGNFLYGPYYEDRGFRYHWIPAARQGVVLTGRCRDGLWHWEHHDIRHCRRGLPRLARHGNCPDYAHLLPADLSQYARVYPRLRRRERAIFVAQRIGCMSWQERAYRLRQLLRKSTS